jgi:hypothetical protein
VVADAFAIREQALAVLRPAERDAEVRQRGGRERLAARHRVDDQLKTA